MGITTRRAAAGVATMLAGALAVPAPAADWTVVPSLRWRESYSDNINLAAGAQARGELVSELTPGVAVTARSTRWQANLAYLLQLNHYQHASSRHSHNLQANLHGAALPDWLFLDGRASISRRTLSAFGPQLTDPANTTGNASEVRSSGVTISLRHRFPGMAMLDARRDVAHSNADSGQLSSRSTDSSLAAASDHGRSKWGWALLGNHRRIDERLADRATLRRMAATLRYAVTGGLAMSLTLGSERNNYRSLGGATEGRFWSAGASWAPSPRTSVVASAGRRIFGNTYGLDARQRTRRSVWRLSYSEDLTTSHTELGDIGPAQAGAVLAQLWQASTPDPHERQQRIEQFLRLSQALGPGLGELRYTGHGLYLQKLLTGSVALDGARNTVLLSMSANRRSAQTATRLDSVPLPPAERTLLDQTRQRGADLVWSWQGAPRTAFNCALSASRTTSLSSGREDRNWLVRAGLTHQFQPHVNGAVDLRHVHHSSSHGGGYRENAAGASLHLTF